MSSCLAESSDSSSVLQEENLILLPNAQTTKLKKTELAKQLTNALKLGQLSVYYQPQIDLQTGTCKHLEALIRWYNPKLGYISPAIFVPIAEELGFVNEITKFTVDQVAHDIWQWQKKYLPIKSVAINISAKHLDSESSFKNLIEQLSSQPILKDHVTLELTETSIVSQPRLAIQFMKMLSTLGFKIALDDFGCGYSSLVHLLEFPISSIKLDRCFALSLTTSSKCQIIVRSLVSMAKKLDIDIVAEGVEGIEQLKLLQYWGCSRVQGFYFSKALPANELTNCLALMSPTKFANTSSK